MGSPGSRGAPAGGMTCPVALFALDWLTPLLSTRGRLGPVGSVEVPAIGATGVSLPLGGAAPAARGGIAVGVPVCATAMTGSSNSAIQIADDSLLILGPPSPMLRKYELQQFETPGQRERFRETALAHFGAAICQNLDFALQPPWPIGVVSVIPLPEGRPR
jgi:hypothetical protein